MTESNGAGLPGQPNWQPPGPAGAGATPGPHDGPPWSPPPAQPGWGAPPPPPPPFGWDAAAPPSSPAAPPVAVRPRRRRWLLIVAPILAIILVVGGVAAAKIFTTLSGTDTPGVESALPAKTIAFAQVNLDPDADQKLAMYSIGRKFPAIKDAVSDSDPAGSLIDYMVRRLGDDEAALTWKDIQSWAGVRAGIALLGTSDAEPYPLLAIQVKDAKKANSGLASLKAEDPSGTFFAIKGGYAYVSDTQAHLDDAMAALAGGTLDASPEFKPAAKTVGDGEVFGAYANIGALAPLAQRYVDLLLSELNASLSELGPIAGGFGDSSSQDPLRAQYDILCPGGRPSIPSLDQSDCDALAALVDGNGIGAGASGLGIEDTLSAALDQLQGIVSLHVELNSDGARLKIDTYGMSPAAPSAGTADAVASLPADSEVAVGISGLSTMLSGAVSDAGKDALDGLLTGSGITVDDVLGLVGDDAAISLRGLSGRSPEWGVIMTGADASSATSMLRELLAGAPAVVAGSGDTYTVASSASYAGKLSSGTLGQSALFKKAVPDAANSSVVLFMDLGSLLADSGDEVAEHLAALGMTQRPTADGSHMELSIVLR